MFQSLPITFPQLIAGNTPENLLNEIHQIIYSLYQSKEITKKVYNNIMRFKAEANQYNISSNTLDEKLDECRMNVG